MGEISQVSVKGTLFDIRDRITEEMAYSAYPTETVTGDIVSITDGAEDIPVKALTVAVEPAQEGSGDPSPDNVRAITGWDAVNVVRTGKNLLPLLEGSSTYNGVTVSHNADGTISVNGTASRLTDFHICGGNSNRPLPDIFTKSGTYKINGGAVGLNGETGNTLYVSISTTDGSARYVGNNSDSLTTFTLETGETVGFFFIRVANGATASNVIFKPMVVEASETDTTFVPYQATTYPIPLPSTVYGGVVDVTKGELTVTHAEIVLDGTEGWGYQDGMFYTGGKHASITYPDGYCDTYKVVKSYAAMQPGDFVISSTTTVIRVKDSRYTDAASFQANIAQNPVKFIWQLATPQVIQLTPTEITTLLGNNTLYADAGQVSVAYRADVGLYIDKRIAEVQALVLES